MKASVTIRRRTRALKRPLMGEDSYDDICCEECGSGDRAGEILLCDKCDRGYHLYCLRPILVAVPKGSWFCPNCSPSNHNNLKVFPLKQTKIEDFFRIQKFGEGTPDLNYRKKKRRSSGLAVSKKRRRLLPFIPSDDSERRLEQMRSLATALIATGAEFRNDLTYMPGMAPKSANYPDLEKDGMQVLSREDIETLNLSKKMMERGEWPPLLVVYDPEEGYTVQADRPIKDWTLITEYVGDVDYLKNRENDDGDSMMTLLCASKPSNSLVICPDKRSNIARFINGINNHTQEGRKKQNLKCVRFNVNGECRVLLVANRDIRQGERLYYDYNGYENEYPTEHFV
ncbi:hypothetical protein V2J09_015499 [Rumex salicifolius]